MAILTAFTLAESLAADQPDLTSSGRSYAAEFGQENDSPVRFAGERRPGSIWQGGEQGPWQVVLAGEMRVDAVCFTVLFFAANQGAVQYLEDIADSLRFGNCESSLARWLPVPQSVVKWDAV